MSVPHRVVSRARLAHIATVIVASVLLVACASNSTSPPTAAGPAGTSQPTAPAGGAISLEGGSWWDPVGPIDYDHGDAINAAEGTIAPVGPDRAIFTSKNGFVVQLVRRNGPKFLSFCD